MSEFFVFHWRSLIFNGFQRMLHSRNTELRIAPYSHSMTKEKEKREKKDQL